MNVQVLREAGLAVQLHLLTIALAIILTLLILFGAKGTKSHKLMGRIWALSMLFTSFVSFFIHDLRPPNGFSPIHGLSIFTIFAVGIGWMAARKGQIKRHKRAMLSVVIGGLVIAGAFTFMPGRLMHNLFFGS